jgi:eukaryotic-like serine/threonine-protein kinase
MDSERWEQIQTLFHGAADLPPVEQRRFLQDACGGDEGLTADVLALLDEDARGHALLDGDLAQVARRVLEESASLLPVREIGPYQIRRLLGEGGMGVVYLAERMDLGSLVAIKLLRDAWLSPARRDRFASEQRTLAQLNHPSIARLYDADTLADGTPWFAMEYVDGVPLNDYCRERRSPAGERLRLFRSVCEAVQYAHAQAVIHRDLKPSNILVKRDGSIRLLDFGIAKQIEGMDSAPEQTRTGLRLMTPAYAAPEQIRGGRVGVHTDVYALGVILYELLAGCLPFDLSNCAPSEAEGILLRQDPEKPSALAGRMALQPGAPAPVDSLGKAAWADLDVLCLTAMHKDPERRYRSVEALVRDLDHYLEGQPLEARPDSLGYRLGKFVRRNRRRVAAATAIAAVMLGLVIFYTARLKSARDADLVEAARTERVQRFMMDLFQGGDEAAGPADNLRVVTLVDRGVQQAHALSSEPAVQAELYAMLGGIYRKLGKFDQADSLLNAALNEQRSLLGPDNGQVAESMVALGLLRADQARFADAERLVRDGLAMSKRHLPANHPAVAKATAALGEVLEDRGVYQQAIPVLEEAVRLQSASGAVTADLASSTSELANANFYAGQYAVSQSLNERVLAIERRLYGERHPMVADTLINLGEIQVQWGHYADAERFLRPALDIERSWYGENHPETADAMTSLAQDLSLQGRYDEAAAMLRQSLGILERLYGPVHPRVAYAVNELALTEQKQGKLNEAEAGFRRVLAIYRSVYGEHHYLVGIAYSNLGAVYLARKQYVLAEPLCRQAVAHFTESLSATHMNTAIARIKLGRALLGEHRYAEARTETLAGYEILTKQTSPSVSWLQSARQDLVAEYGALNQPAQAARFGVELAARSSSPSGPAIK